MPYCPRHLPPVCVSVRVCLSMSGHHPQEFVKWSIKQQRSSGLVNIESLLRRLFGLTLHPYSYKRLGAALALQHVYVSLTPLALPAPPCAHRPTCSLRFPFPVVAPINSCRAVLRYRLIRNDEKIVSHYVLDIVDHMLTSLVRTP